MKRYKDATIEFLMKSEIMEQVVWISNVSKYKQNGKQNIKILEFLKKQSYYEKSLKIKKIKKILSDNELFKLLYIKLLDKNINKDIYALIISKVIFDIEKDGIISNTVIDIANDYTYLEYKKYVEQLKFIKHNNYTILIEWIAGLKNYIQLTAMKTIISEYFSNLLSNNKMIENSHDIYAINICKAAYSRFTETGVFDNLTIRVANAYKKNSISISSSDISIIEKLCSSNTEIEILYWIKLLNEKKVSIHLNQIFGLILKAKGYDDDSKEFFDMVNSIKEHNNNESQICFIEFVANLLSKGVFITKDIILYCDSILEKIDYDKYQKIKK